HARRDGQLHGYRVHDSEGDVVGGIKKLCLSIIALLFLAAPAHAAFPSVATTNTSRSRTTSHTVSLPASIAAGDRLICMSGWNESFGATSPSWPAGWTQKTFQANGSSTSLEVRERFADGSEGASISVTTAVTTRSAHVCYRITGAHASFPVEAGTAATGSSASADPPSLSPSWGSADTLWIAIGSTVAGATYSADPSSYANGLTVDATNGSGGVSIRVTRRTNTTASENPSTYTITSGAWVAQTIAVPPVDVGGSYFPRRAVRGGP